MPIFYKTCAGCFDLPPKRSKKLCTPAFEFAERAEAVAAAKKGRAYLKTNLLGRAALYHLCPVRGWSELEPGPVQPFAGTGRLVFGRAAP